jgi:exopolysaccharide production protein ExoZ
MIKKEGKIVGVQYLRGLAALGVVFCHYGSDLHSYPKLAAIFNFGQSGVDVFFLISGFIIVYSLIVHEYQVKHFFTFMLKRSIRIDPAYLMTILLTLCVFKILSFIPSFRGQSIPFIPGQFLAHLFYVVPFTKYPYYNHVLWTLCVEFQLYILIGLLFFLSNTKIYRISFLLVLCALSMFNWPNGYNVVFTYGAIFATGIALLLFKIENSKLYAILVLFSLIITGLHFGIVISLLLFFSCLIMMYTKVNLPILTFLGNISYSLYLIHSLTFTLFDGVAKKLNADLSSHESLWLLAQVLFAIIMAYCFYRLIEKPSLRFSKRFFYKEKVKPVASPL